MYIRANYDRDIKMPIKRDICKRGHLRIPENLYGRDCKLCHLENAKEWAKANPDKKKRIERRHTLKRRYGLSEEQHDSILQKQNGVCAICKRPFLPSRRPVVDHNHDCCPGVETCGRCIRGLIHQSCNVALGAFQDNPAICRNAAEYLENPPARNI